MPASPRFPKLRPAANPDLSRVQDNIQQAFAPIAEAVLATPITGAPPPAWQNLDLQNGFVTAASVFGDKSCLPAVHKDALGYVHLKGWVVAPAAGAGAGTVIVVLPLGCRPAENHAFPVRGNGAVFQLVDVFPNGNVTCETATGVGGTICLDCTFLAEQ